MTTQQGTVEIWLNHEHKDWWSNKETYSWGPIQKEGIVFSARKYSDRQLEIVMEGPYRTSFILRSTVPDCTPRGLMVVVTWTPSLLSLFLNAQLVKKIEIPTPDAFQGNISKKVVKITISPKSAGIEVVEELVMKPFVPYSRDDIIMLFNPTIQHYQENADRKNVKVRQELVSTSTVETTKKRFDLRDDNVHLVCTNERFYSVKLLAIGTESIDGDSFPSYDFLVIWN